MTLRRPPNITIIVQARMGSTRLPGKVLKEVNGKPLLMYLLERLKRVKNAHSLLVATTCKAEDRPIIDLCDQMDVMSFKGEELDVLERYRAAAVFAQAEGVVRITADCPLIDPAIVDQAILAFVTTNPPKEYLSNVYPERTFPRGMDVEVFSTQALEKAAQEAQQPEEREHVTLYFCRHPDRFRIGGMEGRSEGLDCRLTVDTKEDFLLVKRLLETLYPPNPDFSLGDVLDLLKKHPEWKKINAHVAQRRV